MGSRRTRRRSASRKRSGVRKGIPRGYADVPSYEEIVVKLKCGRCGKTLEAEGNFYPKSGSKRGYQNECITCRKEINKKYTKKKNSDGGTEKREEQKRSRKQASTSDFKKGGKERRATMEQAADKIKKGEVVGPTTRTFHYSLKTILEYQFNKFYAKKSMGPVGRRKLEVLISEAMFEISESLTRLSSRVRNTDLHTTDKGIEDGFVYDGEEEARRVLGVSSGASLLEIRRRYRSLAKKAHPDAGGSEDRMSELNRAMEVLTGGENGC